MLTLGAPARVVRVMPDFTPTLDELKRDVDQFLDRFLKEKAGLVPEAAPLIEEIAHVVHLGGKRLRPAFCYWGYRAGGGGHGDAIMRAAAALELLHTFALVHDDIMDAGAFRRGAPSTQAVHGVNFALLVGDLALVLADAALVESGFKPEDLARAFVAYSRMRQQVIAGQYLDLSVAGEAQISEQEARRIALLKSGLYSIVEPLLIGATLAGAGDALRSRVEAFGRPLGEAFQLRDDLLGLFGDPATVGKPIDSDVREGKRNLVFAKTVELLEGDDRTFFLQRWGAGERLSDDDVTRLRELVESSGARAVIEGLLRDLRAQSERALEDLQSDPQVRSALLVLVAIATERRG